MWVMRETTNVTAVKLGLTRITDMPTWPGDIQASAAKLSVKKKKSLNRVPQC